MISLPRYALTACFLLWAHGSASSLDQTKLKADQILISYVEPKNPQHQKILQILKERQVLEKFREILSPVRLPRTLLLQMKGCDGEVNGWYDFDERAITICYELIQKNFDDRPKGTTPAGVTSEDAFVGPVAEIFLHEAGHAIFDLLEVPIFGHEEDAADQFAAYMILRLKSEEARRLIRGVAYLYGHYAKKEMKNLDFGRFADEHGQPAQRYFTYLCLAYGSDPKEFADTAKKIPPQRTERCEAEFAQVDFAFKKLITPYIDPDVRKSVKNREWLKGRIKN